MTFPTVESITTSQNNSATTTASVTLPSTINSGDLLLMLVRGATTSTTFFDVPSGWHRSTGRGNSGRSEIFVRVADGTESSSVTIGSAVSRRSVHIVYRITGSSKYVSAAFVGSNTSDPPNRTAAWGSEDNLYIAFTTSNSSDGSNTSAPTSYGDFTTIKNSTSSASTAYCKAATAHRLLAASSDNPSAFGTSGTISTPHAATIIVRPVPSTVEVSSIEELDNLTSISYASVELSKNLDFNDDNSYDDPLLKSSYTTGIGWTGIFYFNGSFNGKGYSISNLYTNPSASAFQSRGLFQELSGNVTNLRILSASITNPGDNTRTGILCSRLIPPSNYYNPQTISRIETTGTVSCTATGSGGITSQMSVPAGGLIGQMFWSARTIPVVIENCFSRASITVSCSGDYATAQASGLIGRDELTSSITMDKCYGACTLTATSTGATGAVANEDGIGRAGTLEPTNTFWDSTLTPTDGFTTTTGKTTAQMKNIATFNDTATPGLDVVWSISGLLSLDTEIWTIVNSITYPMLSFERTKVNGAGTELSPYELQDWYHLADIRNDLDSYFKLVNNLDSSTDGYSGYGDDWTPIEIGFDAISCNLDGDGHTISDFIISGSGVADENWGLFGRIANSSASLTITNLGFIGGSITLVMNCAATNGVGPFLGHLSIGSVTLTNCFNRGCDVSVTGTNQFADNFGGGLIGYRSGGTPTINKCYAACEVIATNDDVFGGVGVASGIINGTNTTTNSFWDTTIGPATSDGGTGKTTAEMKDIDTYTDTATTGLDEAWDFSTIWAIDSEVNGGYPYFGVAAVGVTVGIKLSGTFVDKPMKIKKSGTFEDVSAMQTGGWV